jgi:hypothetical protein
MKAYLIMRWWVVSRQLAELGWWRLILLSLLLGLFLARALAAAAADARLQWGVPVAVASIVASAHRQRSDLVFLQITAPQYRRWVALEYGLVSLSAVLTLLAWGCGGSALLTLLLAAVVAWLPASKARAARSRLPSMFRSVAFEWVGGLRSVGHGLLWLVLLAVGVWGHGGAVGPAVAMVAWLVCVGQIYGIPEPWSMLLPSLVEAPGAWLRQRLVWGLLYFTLTAAPFIWLMGTGLAGWGGAAALLLWSWVMLVMILLAKYAFYPNAFLLRSIQAGVLLLGFLILSSNSAYAAVLTAAFIGLLLKSRRRLALYHHA